MKIVFEFKEGNKVFNTLYYKTQWNYLVPRVGEKIIGSALFNNFKNNKYLIYIKDYLLPEFKNIYSQFNELVIKIDTNIFGKRTVYEKQIFKEWFYGFLSNQKFEVTEIRYDTINNEIIAVLTIVLV